MDRHEELYKRFREAAMLDTDEHQETLSAENIWNRVTERLDEQKRRPFILFKRLGIAASLLLLILSGTFFLFHQQIDKSVAKIAKNNTPESNSENQAKVPDRNMILTREQKAEEQPVNTKTTNVSHSAGSIPVSQNPGETAYALPYNKDNKDQSIDEIQIYGRKIDRRSYTGALTTVTSEQIAKRPVTDIAAAINGAAPGIQVTTKNGSEFGYPQLLANIQKNRSQKPALIIKDGKLYKGSLEEIDPGSIKTITLLKGEEAEHIYGIDTDKDILVISTRKMSIFRKIANKLFRTNKTEYPQIIQITADTNEDNDEASIENSFTTPLTAPLSTFSVDVDNASYTSIRNYIDRGMEIPKDEIRIEEMINYFQYDYAAPVNNDPVALHTEYADAPWNPQHKILKIGLQAREIPAENLPPSNLVFLIDVSGSMNDENKLPLLVSSLKLLVSKLDKKDMVSIVVYAGAAGVVLPPTHGNDKERIIESLDQLEAGGSTAGGAGIEMAYKLAEDNYIPGGNNRVILATDGDFNVGPSSDFDMKELIEEKRKSNIYLTCLGYGMGNYKDSRLETLADHGDGNYAYIDNIKEANRFLVKTYGGTMFTVAKDVKIQVAFNPDYIQSYRLIGYENRVLKEEDFANDAVDAGDMGSGHSVTALYEIIPAGITSKYVPEETMKSKNRTKEKFSKKSLASIKFRYKNPGESRSRELVQKVDALATETDATSADYKLATAVAWFGLKLRESTFVPDLDQQHLVNWTKKAIENTEDEYREELLELIEDSE